MLPVQVVDSDPVCPHCKATMQGLYSRRVRSDLGKAYVWSCPHCHKVLGVSHRKGFWMG